MAAGLVPILSDIPPFREFLRRAGSGLIVDANDLGSAAQAIVAFDFARPARDRSKLIETAAKYAWPGGPKPISLNMKVFLVLRRLINLFTTSTEVAILTKMRKAGDAPHRRERPTVVQNMDTGAEEWKFW
jgi:hypothetical protein